MLILEFKMAAMELLFTFIVSRSLYSQVLEDRIKLPKYVV